MLFKGNNGAIYINNEKWICSLFFVLLLCSTMAIFSSKTTLLSETGKQIIYFVRPIMVLCGIILFFFYYIGNKERIKHRWILLIPIVHFIFRNLDRYSNDIVGILSTCEIAGYIFLSSKYQLKIYKCFRYFLTFQAIMGIIGYVLYISDIEIYRVVPYYSTIYGSYIDFGGTYLLKSNLAWPRLCGLFDEPGHFGTFLALFLCVEEVDLKKRYNLLFLIAGVLTFSLAFFVIISMYLLLTLFKNKKRFFIILILIFIVLSIGVHFENRMFIYLVSRIEFQDGKFKGDNRSNINLDLAYQEVISSEDDMFFGRGRGFSLQPIYRGASSIKMYIVDFGIIGIIILYFPLFFVAWKRADYNMSVIAFIFCFFSSIYQRPAIHILPFYVILFGGIEYMMFMGNRKV